jgi:hypothetical protein
MAHCARAADAQRAFWGQRITILRLRQPGLLRGFVSGQLYGDIKMWVKTILFPCVNICHIDMLPLLLQQPTCWCLVAD